MKINNKEERSSWATVVEKQGGWLCWGERR